MHICMSIMVLSPQERPYCDTEFYRYDTILITMAEQRHLMYRIHFWSNITLHWIVASQLYSNAF